MADYDSSLPIRTENNGDVVSRISDGTVTSQLLAVNADGSINITDNSGSITVDGSVTVSATDLDIRDLSAAQDNVAISDGTDTLAVNADGSINSVVSATNLDIRDLVFATDKVDVSGSTVSATVSATDLDIRDLSASQDNVAISDGTDTLAVNADGSLNITDNGGSLTVDATNLDIRDLVFATDKVDVSGSNITISATDLDIRDLSHTQDSVKVGDGTDFLAVNADGSINVVVTDNTPGSPVNDYSTATVAGGASSTHTYTSTGNFYLTQIEATGSGKLKIEVKVNAVSKFVQFNSTANPNMQIQLTQPILATTGQTVTIIRDNRENQSQDVYSTISGYTL